MVSSPVRHSSSLAIVVSSRSAVYHRVAPDHLSGVPGSTDRALELFRDPPSGTSKRRGYPSTRKWGCFTRLPGVLQDMVGAQLPLFKGNDNPVSWPPCFLFGLWTCMGPKARPSWGQKQNNGKRNGAPKERLLLRPKPPSFVVWLRSGAPLFLGNSHAREVKQRAKPNQAMRAILVEQLHQRSNEGAQTRPLFLG